MTIERYNYLIRNAYVWGKEVECVKEATPFGLEEATIKVFHFEGYEIGYKDSHFLYMKNLSTKKCVEQKDCTAFEVGEMSDEDLTKFIAEARKRAERTAKQRSARSNQQLR